MFLGSVLRLLAAGPGYGFSASSKYVNYYVLDFGKKDRYFCFPFAHATRLLSLQRQSL